MGSDNGSAPTRQQAIVWASDGLFPDAYVRHSASMRYKVISQFVTFSRT